MVGIYTYGTAIGLYVYLCRVAGKLISPNAITMVFMHAPSRRNGIPWFAKSVVKAVGWPVVLGVWIGDGRPSSPVLFGPAAAVRLGIDPDSLSYASNAFATMWKAHDR